MAVAGELGARFKPVSFRALVLELAVEASICRCASSGRLDDQVPDALCLRPPMKSRLVNSGVFSVRTAFDPREEAGLIQ